MILDQLVTHGEHHIIEDDAPITSHGAITLERWLELSACQALPADVGVVIYADTDLTPLEPHLDALPFAAVHFERFVDGRGYSHARRLRKLWGYRGPIIAFGDVLRDQILYMSRCGINGFYMREDQDLTASLAAFSLYTEHYQYRDEERP